MFRDVKLGARRGAQSVAKMPYRRGRSVRYGLPSLRSSVEGHRALCQTCRRRPAKWPLRRMVDSYRSALSPKAGSLWPGNVVFGRFRPLRGRNRPPRSPDCPPWLKAARYAVGRKGLDFQEIRRSGENGQFLPCGRSMRAIERAEPTTVPENPNRDRVASQIPENTPIGPSVQVPQPLSSDEQRGAPLSPP